MGGLINGNSKEQHDKNFTGLILGVLSIGGVTYLIVNQFNNPKMGKRMGSDGSMTPSQMDDSQNHMENSSSSNI